MRVVNQKFSREATIYGKNLHGNKRYGDDTKIYVNNSFCPEFKFLNYVIRKATREKLINRYKIRNGIMHIRKD